MVAAYHVAWSAIAALVEFTEIVGLVIVGAADYFVEAFLVIVRREISRLANSAGLIDVVDRVAVVDDSDTAGPVSTDKVRILAGCAGCLSCVCGGGGYVAETVVNFRQTHHVVIGGHVAFVASLASILVAVVHETVVDYSEALIPLASQTRKWFFALNAETYAVILHAI